MLAWVVGCAISLQAAAAAGGFIPGVTNVEDMAPLAGGRWVLLSSIAGGLQTAGALYVIDTQGHQLTKLYPTAGMAQSVTSATCPGEVAPSKFSPHGIAVRAEPGRPARLFVVNHGGRESIELFDIDAGVMPHLRWVGCVVLPPHTLGNAVVAKADGTLFVSNNGLPLDGSKPLTPIGGDVMQWQASSGWRPVPGSDMPVDNGLVLSPDEQRLYVAAWAGSTVSELTLATGARRTVRVPLLPDNLRWSATGSILATGHLVPVATVADCFLSKRATCHIPSAVAEIDPATMTVRCSEPVDLDMATSTIPVGDATWVSPARGNTILRRPADAACPAH